MEATALRLVPQEEEVGREVVSIETQAKELKVVDPVSYVAAGELWKSIKGIRKKIADTFDPIIKKAHEVHKEAVARKKEHDAPLDVAERIVKRAMSAYDEEQERIRKAEQERLAEIARKEEEDRQLADAIAAEEAAKEAGATEDEAAQVAEAVMEQPVSVAPVVIPKATPKLQGGPVYREVWAAEVTDIKALCRAVADGKASTECVMANMPTLNRMATALKSTMNVPGVRAYSRRV